MLFGAESMIQAQLLEEAVDGLLWQWEDDKYTLKQLMQWDDDGGCLFMNEEDGNADNRNGNCS